MEAETQSVHTLPGTDPGQAERPADMDESPAEDKRLDFIADYVLRTLKLKQDKWQKCVSSEESRQVLQDFLDKAERRTLVVSVTAAGLLQPAAAFAAAAARNKAVYFVKRSGAALSPGSMRESLVYGDLSYAPLDQFSALVEEVSSGAECVNYCWRAAPALSAPQCSCRAHTTVCHEPSCYPAGTCVPVVHFTSTASIQGRSH